MTVVPDPSKPLVMSVMFNNAGQFAALREATALLVKAGFSVGPTQRGAPAAVMFGDYLIAKWKNLNGLQRRETHATLTGDNRNGPLTIRLLPAAPPEAHDALNIALGDRA